MASITISQKQTPCFRALIATESGALFDPQTDLATQSELTTEGIELPPISYSVFKTSSAVYRAANGDVEPVEGYQNVEIDVDALIEPTDFALEDLEYNFSFTPESRATFPFEEPGGYFVDFIVYPKTGAAIVWRVWVTVE